jgi:Flp pilus assembly protein TadD
MRANGGAVAAIVAAALMTGRAWGADSTDADRVLAAALFRDGRALIAERRYSEACPKLQESQRLDPGGARF